MKTPTFPVPPMLLGQPLESPAIPRVFAHNLEARGICLTDPLPQPHRGSPHKHGLTEEFAHSPAYHFDWGMIVAGFPPWYYPEDHLPGLVWRVVPLALWERLHGSGCVLPPIPVAMADLRRAVTDVIYPRVPNDVECDPGLGYDLFVMLVNDPSEGHDLFHWIEQVFLPEVLPPALQYLEALALERYGSQEGPLHEQQ